MMQLTIMPTDEFDVINGADARRWVGQDDTGCTVVAWLLAVSPQTNDKVVEARYAAALRELPTGTEQPSATTRAKAMIADKVIDWLNVEIRRGSTPRDLLTPFAQAMGMALAAYVQASTQPGHQAQALGGILKMMAIYAATTEIAEEPLQ